MAPLPDPSPETTPLHPVDIAPTAVIKTTRTAVADVAATLRLCRFDPEERAAAGGTLSAAELGASQATARFLVSRPDVGDDAGIQPDLFQHRLDANLALAQLGRAAGQVEAAAAIGEMILAARITEHNDRVFAYAEGDEATAEERAALTTYLASADLIYEREAQLQRDRKARATLRKDRRATELAEAQDERERLRARERLQGGTLPER